MPSTINANNSTGLVTTADTSAVLELQTGGTTALSISTGQVVSTTNGAIIQGLTVGRGAGAVATNTAVGASALANNTTGSQGVFIGAGAGLANTTGINNIAVGYRSLYSGTTTGGQNVGVGSYALYGVTTGANNSGFGQETLQSNTTGSANVAAGTNALNSNTTASNNTAVGYQAGYSNVAGSYNTLIGYQAGYSLNTSGNTLNTFVGQSAGYNITTGTKNTIIGTYNGNQGGLDIRTASNRIVLSDGDGNPRLHIDNSGYAYIPSIPVGGTANMHWSSSGGQLFVTSSSRRFKHDIVDYDKGLTELMQMRPKYFVYNDEPSQKQRAGFIAEDFHDLGFTEYVEYWKDQNNQDTPSEIGYSNMVAILVKSIQELKAEFDAYKASHP